VDNLDPADVLDHATSEIASGSKLGIDATKKMPGEPRKLSGLAAAHEDGSSGEGECGKVFRFVAAYTKRRKLIQTESQRDSVPKPRARAT
jgi:3-polyprenyl-4-hydroxybenzoate decarboxylase